jgi:hypothetical protein
MESLTLYTDNQPRRWRCVQMLRCAHVTNAWARVHTHTQTTVHTVDGFTDHSRVELQFEFLFHNSYFDPVYTQCRHEIHTHHILWLCER